jgi:hypothetical protein
MTQNKMSDEQFDKLLTSALKRSAQATQVDKLADDAAVARVLTRLAAPLPRQKMPLWRWPAVLLDWQFAPAWPRMAVLASCAALGFLIGMAGLDRTFDRADAASLALFDDSDGIGP